MNAQELHNEVVETYVDITVDRMTTEELVKYVSDDLHRQFTKMTDNDFKEYVFNNDDEYLYDELNDYVTEDDDTTALLMMQEIKYDREVD
tara:strand:+ start:948 stop:1217 length:270 start_codon:yes stop_codon:yes gene_type:complete